MSKPDFVLVHGWGLNEEVWSSLVEPLSDHYNVHCLSLPGYGKRHHASISACLNTLADDLLAQAPESAIWCGWSLGGMAALAAALKVPKRIQALNLLCVTPRFTNDEDWQSATDIETFSKFADDLASDYKRGIRRFLLLQAGSFDHSRELAKRATADVNKHPAPTSETLFSGLEILKTADLRNELSELKTPCHVIAGLRDRVVPPEACSYMASQIPGARYSELNSGHAPHLSHPEGLIALLIGNMETRERPE